MAHKDPVKRAAYLKAWQEKNKEQIKTRNKQLWADTLADPQKHAEKNKQLREYKQKRYATDPEYQKAERTRCNQSSYQKKRKDKYHQNRKDCISHYGGQCACCKEQRLPFLAIDHVNGGGNQHRKSLKGKYRSIYEFLKAHNYPDGYRVLCHNCNCAIGFYGICPHEQEKQEKRPRNATRPKEIDTVQLIDFDNL